MQRKIIKNHIEEHEEEHSDGDEHEGEVVIAFV